MPRTGFEPARLAALPPQSSASANSATWALYVGPEVEGIIRTVADVSSRRKMRGVAAARVCVAMVAEAGALLRRHDRLRSAGRRVYEWVTRTVDFSADKTGDDFPHVG